MHDESLLVLSGDDVLTLLRNRENEIIDAVRAAYQAHGRGHSALPHSTFLQFPAQPEDRIIALPAYIGEGFNVAGIKWIASFPGNLAKGLDRASAVIILNSMQTGRPEAIIEGSVISAKRTAASGALAAQLLQDGKKTESVSLVGCGLINFEMARFLLNRLPGVRRLTVFDKDPARAHQFKKRCRELAEEIEVTVASDMDTVLRSAPLISIATTAARPHLSDLSMCAAGSTVLHISLRDISPEAILACDNIVDDINHVCRAQTSVHLAEGLVGHRDFIRCTLADIIAGRAAPRKDAEGIAVFSPFGLGVLDLAVSQLVFELALKGDVGTRIGSFLPDSWSQSSERKRA